MGVVDSVEMEEQPILLQEGAVDLVEEEVEPMDWAAAAAVDSMERVAPVIAMAAAVAAAADSMEAIAPVPKMGVVVLEIVKRE